MILHARELAKEEQADCEFQVMDAENPEYDNDTFDFVISRNLTWTLPDAQKAYKEWMRVLKPGGVLLNFEPIMERLILRILPIFRKIMPITRLKIH